MGTWVPLADFDVCAKVFTDKVLKIAHTTAYDLLDRVFRAAVEQPNHDGWVAGIYVGKGAGPVQQSLTRDKWYPMWNGYTTALVCYTSVMGSECRARGIDAPQLKTRWGYDLTFAELIAWQHRLRELWSGVRITPSWLADAELGRRHQVALAALEPQYQSIWG